MTSGAGGHGLTLSVVIPTHNRRNSLLRLLAALRLQLANADDLRADRVDVVVVADGCVDDTAAELRGSIARGDWPFAVTLLEQSPSRGAGIARNAGAQAAQGDVIIFVDDDIEPFPTMLATHAQLHESARSRGESLLVCGAPTPSRVNAGDGVAGPSSGELHHTASWGWWEQTFERMERAGHRFTYEDVLTGVLSIPRSLFLAVGGFDASLAHCHEDYELGLRLFRAGARGAFAREAGGVHHEPRSLPRLLLRKYAEGIADVRIAERWPELTPHLNIGGAAAARHPLGGLVRWIAFRLPKLAALATRAAVPVVELLDRLRLRGTWRTLHLAVLYQQYWLGAASELGSTNRLESLLARNAQAAERWRRSATSLTLDLDEGIAAAESLVDAHRPDALVLRLDDQVVGEVDALPTGERLHGQHLRRLLATTAADSLRLALALRDARSAAPSDATARDQRA